MDFHFCSSFFGASNASERTSFAPRQGFIYTYVTYVVCWFWFAHLNWIHVDARRCHPPRKNNNQETMGNPQEKCCQGCLEVRSLELRNQERRRDGEGWMGSWWKWLKGRAHWRVNDWKMIGSMGLYKYSVFNSLPVDVSLIYKVVGLPTQFSWLIKQSCYLQHWFHPSSPLLIHLCGLLKQRTGLEHKTGTPWKMIWHLFMRVVFGVVFISLWLSVGLVWWFGIRIWVHPSNNPFHFRGFQESKPPGPKPTICH